MKNIKSNKNSEENIILNSLGLLSGKEKNDFVSDFKNFNSNEKKLISEFNNLTSLFSKVISDKEDITGPSPDVKENIFKKLNSDNFNTENKSNMGFEYVFAEQSEWLKHPVEGIEFKQLSYNEKKDYVLLLLRVAPDTYYPAHHHSGAEECYVISGDVYAQGKVLGPGDFHHAEGGSDHEPLYTKNGCTVLLVVDPEDYN